MIAIIKKYVFSVMQVCLFVIPALLLFLLGPVVVLAAGVLGNQTVNTDNAIPGIFTLDLALLGAAATIGIYTATARLTLLGWLVQYKINNVWFVKRQILCLSGFLTASFIAGTGSLFIIGSRTHGWNIHELLEGLLFILWAVIVVCFIVFHIWAAIYRRKAKNGKQPSKPLIDQLGFIAAQIETGSTACSKVAKQMEAASTQIKAAVEESIKAAKVLADQPVEAQATGNDSVGKASI